MANSDYQSSEELQRHNADVFSLNVNQKKKEENKTEKDKLRQVLDKYIAKHNSTKSVREMSVEHDRDATYQLDLSADLVEILEKIKSELR